MLLTTPLCVLPSQESERDISALVAAFRGVHRDAIIAEMDPWEPFRGSLEMPEEVQERLRPQTALVLAAGANCEGVKPYDRIIVKRSGGLWIDGFPGATGQVRIYGPMSPSERMYMPGFPGEGVLGILTKTIKAYKDKVFIRRDAQMESQGGILLADKTKGFLPPMGEVVSAGPSAFLCHKGEKAEAVRIMAGDRLVYNPLAVEDFVLGHEAYGLNPDEKYCFIKAADCYAVIS